MPAGYSKRSLVDKLGIKPSSKVAIVNKPAGFDAVLGPLPQGVNVSSKPGKDLDFIHAFFLSSSNLDRNFPTLKRALSPSGCLWISWPKKAAKMQTDLSDNRVREIGLKHGLVDIKVCAVDEVWSGLKFVYRLHERL
ncbi:MAG: DUF3052 domain-containing protein, partial [Acidobacteria bacterium]|nr:DUF3052 domain-containing protein [Acidobacteriota bacterium]